MRKAGRILATLWGAAVAMGLITLGGSGMLPGQKL